MATNNVKALREASNITLSELSEATKIPRVTLSMYETGRANPSIDNAYALCEAFGVRLNDLFNRGGIDG